MNKTKEMLINSALYYKVLVNDVKKATKIFWKRAGFEMTHTYV